VTVTARIQARSALGRVYQALTSSVVRTCTRCGWAGRMRWRLAPARMRGQR
jgi:RNase P subunit RPR2